MIWVQPTKPFCVDDGGAETQADTRGWQRSVHSKTEVVVIHVVLDKVDVVYTRSDCTKATMTRYYFDIHDGAVSVDDVGTECSDIEAVRAEARRLLPELNREALPPSSDHHTIRVVVRDENQEIVYTATLIFSGHVVDRSKATVM